MTIVPVIVSGGAGLRLWPFSHAGLPKPLMTLPDGTTLMQHALRRAAQLPGTSEILIVTGADQHRTTEAEWDRLELAPIRRTYMLEPAARDTCPAIALAALKVEQTHGGDAMMIVMPADHLIPDNAAFAAAVETARQLARMDRIVTFGIAPTRPETGFGYIEVEGAEVRRFVEKPDEATAAGYLGTGRHYWNSGIFCFRSGQVLQRMEKLCPRILQQCRHAIDGARHTGEESARQIRLDLAPFHEIEPVSFDRAVLEHVDRLAMVPCDFEWSDIGSHEAYAALFPADEAGNHAPGVILDSCRGTIVLPTEKPIAAIGLSDIIVADTAHGLLLLRKGHGQDVRSIARRLAPAGARARTVERPWGGFTILDESASFAVKRLMVKPQAKLSLQSHRHRTENWAIVSGTALVTMNGETTRFETGGSTTIPPGVVHRLENAGTAPLVVIETQTGSYLGEDDIIRYEDIYGRVPSAG